MAELYGLIVCACVIAVLAVTTWRPWDTWPLTCYPMFSGVVRLDSLRIHRIALVDEAGGVSWWAPTFPRMQRRVCKRLLRTGPLNAPAADDHQEAERAHLFAEVLRRLPPAQRSSIRALQVMERRTKIDAEGQAQVIDRALCTVPVMAIAP